MSGTNTPLVCQQTLHDGRHEVFIEWPDGERWTLNVWQDEEAATRFRGALVAEIAAWNWRWPSGGPLHDPQVPLLILAWLWRTLSADAFNGLARTPETDTANPLLDNDADPDVDDEQFDDDPDFAW